MNRQECFINGFVKQALEFGFSEQEIVSLYNHKVAADVINTLAAKKPMKPVVKKPIVNPAERNDAWRPKQPSVPIKRLPGESEYE